MKSIRFSLVIYFLLLILVAETAVSVLVYRIMNQTLADKEASTRSLLLAQYESRCRDLKEELDNRLQRRALTLAALARSQWVRSRYDELNLFLGVSTTPANPLAILTVSWLSELTDNPTTHQLRRRPMLKIDFAEDVLPETEEHEREYFQVFNEFGESLQRSRSLEENSFTLDGKVRESTLLFDPHFDDTNLTPDLRVRRVTLHATVSKGRMGFGGPPPSQSSRQRGNGQNEPREEKMPNRDKSNSREPPPPRDGRQPRPPDRSWAAPRIFIQYAANSAPIDSSILEFQTEMDQSMAQRETESTEMRASLKKRLLLISLLTFAATVVGGYWLVRIGLSPLGRLSDAVSQISVKDFRLPIESKQLPTELQPIAHQLTEALELLKRAFAREKQAAADLSHELRTPLSALLMTAEVTLRKPRGAEEYREALESCRETGQQMSRLVERLLALARLDAGVDTMRPQKVDVTALAQQCAALVRPLANARELDLVVQSKEPAYLQADPDKLGEVLTNLLHNAIEYNRPQGNVTVSVERENGHLQLEVADTGIGISSEAREHIFERFYRADPSRQADSLHAGLGLSIVKGYVDMMGGTIAVESILHQGSRFRVTLPAL